MQENGLRNWNWKQRKILLFQKNNNLKNQKVDNLIHLVRNPKDQVWDIIENELGYGYTLIQFNSI